MPAKNPAAPSFTLRIVKGQHIDETNLRDLSDIDAFVDRIDRPRTRVERLRDTIKLVV